MTDWIQASTFSGDAVFAGSRDEGCFLSTNNGVSGMPRNEGLGNVSINALASEGVRVFAGTADAGVFRTENLGDSWAAVNDGLPTENVTALLMTEDGILAGTADGDDTGGIFASADHGDSWVPDSEGLPPGTHIRGLAKSESHVFAGTGAGEVFCRCHAGSHWLWSRQHLFRTPCAFPVARR